MERIAEKIKNKICESNPSLTEQQAETIKFGLECVLSEASKISAYFIIFALFSLTEYYIVALSFFSITRIFAGGYHTDTYLKCFAISFLALSAAIIIGSQFSLSFLLRLIFLLAAIVIAWLFAPVDHPNKPIISLERRRRFKYISVLVYIILSASTLIMKNELAVTATMILFIEAILLILGYVSKKKISIICSE